MAVQLSGLRHGNGVDQVEALLRGRLAPGIDVEQSPFTRYGMERTRTGDGRLRSTRLEDGHTGVRRQSG